MTDESAPQQAQAPQMEACKGPSGYIFILAMMLLVFIMFGGLGDSVASIAGVVLDPLIGFNGRYPVITMLLAGSTTIIVSTITRHFMVDWVEMARKQKILGEYNKQVRAATKSGDPKASQKLNEQNQDILGMQSSMMMDQMKSSVITMVIAILIFRWLFSFIQGLEHPTLAVPWDMHFALLDYAFKQVCGNICSMGSGGGMPYWIFVYIIITIPLGQALMRGLKYFQFSRKLRDRGHDIFGIMTPKVPREAPKAPSDKKETPKQKAQRERDELRQR